MTIKTKSICLAVGLVVLATGAQALTPAGDPITPTDGSETRQGLMPEWQQFTVGKGDTHWRYANNWLRAKGLEPTEQNLKRFYSTVEAMAGNKDVVWTRDDQGNPLLVAGQTVYLPTITAQSTASAETQTDAAARPLTAAELTILARQNREILDKTLPDFANAIRGNATAVGEVQTLAKQTADDVEQQAEKISGLKTKVDTLAEWQTTAETVIADHGQSIAVNTASVDEAKTLAEQAATDAAAGVAAASGATELATAAGEAAATAAKQAAAVGEELAEFQTATADRIADFDASVATVATTAATAAEAAEQATSDVNGLKDRVDGLEDRVDNLSLTGGSNWWSMAGVAGLALALLALLGLWLKPAKLRKADAKRLDDVEATAQQAADTAEAADVKASSAQQMQTGRGIDWDASTVEDLKVFAADPANVGETAVWQLLVDGEQVNVMFTLRDDGRMDWNVPSKEGQVRQSLVKLSKMSVMSKLNTAYDDDCLEAMKQPSPVSAVAA